MAVCLPDMQESANALWYCVAAGFIVSGIQHIW